MNEHLEKLQLQLHTNELKYEDWEKYYQNLCKEQREFKKLLEYARDKEAKLEQLSYRVTSDYASDLVDSLRNKGFALKKEKNLCDAFENMGYRLLEQARAGKRDDVYYGILRIFVANKKKLPDDLAEVFKPIYSNEMFKVFIFSFLSGIIGKDNQNENKN